MMILVVILAVTAFAEVQGCAYSQFGANHVMCKFTKAGCALNQKGITPQQQQEIVDTHNELRQKIASGSQSDQPPAADMNLLKWNAELATIAQRWAEQCIFDHYKPRNTVTFKAVGQNLYTSSASSPDSFREAVKSWYDEVKDFDQSRVSNYQDIDPPDVMVGHYTQLVWGKTTDVGCGFALYAEPDSDDMRQILVCNYGPAGNFIGSPLYIQGDGCSKCQSCSSKYDALCTA